VYSKILVGLGSADTTTDYSTKVEIIDLTSTTSVCPALPLFPLKLVFPVGGLGYQNEVTICGGLDGSGIAHSECKMLIGGSWQNAHFNLTLNRTLASFAFNPENHGNGRIVVSGGRTDYQVMRNDSAEITFTFTFTS
jgi:hypothetical protein